MILYFAYLVALGGVKLAEGVRGEALPGDDHHAAAPPDPVHIDGGDHGRLPEHQPCHGTHHHQLDTRQKLENMDNEAIW